MKKPVFAANWKMNLGPQETRAYLKTFLETFAPTEDRTVMIFPSAISLVVAGFALRERKDILIGVQNIHWEDTGASTGANGASMAHDAGATVALVGHAERRNPFRQGRARTARRIQERWRVSVSCVSQP